MSRPKQAKGEIVPDDFLSADTKLRMVEIWRKASNPEDKEDELLQFANLWAHHYFSDTQQDETPANHQNDLKDLAKLAERLRLALERSSLDVVETMDAHAYHAMHGKTSPLDVRVHCGMGQFVNSTHQWVQALELVADHAASQIVPCKSFSSKKERIKGFTDRMAEFCTSSTGKPPPKDRSAWFAGLVSAAVGSDVGWRVIHAAITQTKTAPSHR